MISNQRIDGVTKELMENIKKFIDIANNRRISGKYGVSHEEELIEIQTRLFNVYVQLSKLQYENKNRKHS